MRLVKKVERQQSEAEMSAEKVRWTFDGLVVDESRPGLSDWWS